MDVMTGRVEQVFLIPSIGWERNEDNEIRIFVNWLDRVLMLIIEKKSK